MVWIKCKPDRHLDAADLGTRSQPTPEQSCVPRRTTVAALICLRPQHEAIRCRSTPIVIEFTPAQADALTINCGMSLLTRTIGSPGTGAGIAMVACEG